MRDKILIFLSTVLLVAVGVEGYYLYKMDKKLNSKEAYYKPVVQKSINHLKPQVSKQVKNQTNISQSPTNSDPFKQFALNNNLTLNPFKEFQKMQEQMNKVFGSFNARFQNDPDFDKFFKDFTVSPSLDMKDLGDKYVINIDIPGSKENNIKVSVKNHILKVEAKTSNKIDKKSSHFIQQERYVGNFEREITLPSDADENSLKTKYINGVLVITLKKK